MQTLLIDKYGYDPEDIVVLIDDGDPAHPQPTRANVLAQIKHLVKDVRDGDKLFFHYAGHADQMDTDDIAEEDGKNEFILTCDGLSIIDNELKAEIVDPLQNIQCTLTAVLDCCHSGSLLDLPHIHCNDVYVPWLNKGRRRTKTLWADCRKSPEMFTPLESAVPDPAPTVLDIPTLITPRKEHPKPAGLAITTSSCYPTPPASHESRQPSFDGIPAIGVTNASPVDGDFDASTMYVSPERYMANSPVAVYEYCTGKCRDDPLVRFRIDTARAGVNVTCISAAKDNELAWESGEGKSMTQYLVQNLNAKSKPTLHNLMTSISHDIHLYYVNDLHQKARAYKKKVNARCNGQRSEDAMALVVEMHNFQNPQLSSLLPMNMEQVFDP
ncbi:peptidase C14, caspase domain-containing protein [Pholiota molesta]|nr:peptidase C14, caspase domain-containing protein [Pholiota molesta]